MTLQELAASYAESSALCRKRAAELNEAVSDPELSEMERMLLRRRICVLLGMARETGGVSKYLATYRGEEAQR